MVFNKVSVKINIDCGICTVHLFYDFWEKKSVPCFDEIRDSRLWKDSTSSLERKKLNDLIPK